MLNKFCPVLYRPGVDINVRKQNLTVGRAISWYAISCSLAVAQRGSKVTQRRLAPRKAPFSDSQQTIEQWKIDRVTSGSFCYSPSEGLDIR